MNIRKQLIRLGTKTPELRKSLKPIIATLTFTPQQVVLRGQKRCVQANLLNRRVADARSYVGPGINNQLIEGLIDIAFEQNYSKEYRDGLHGEVTFKTLNAFSAFAHKVELALREYALDPKNAENVKWGRFYAKGHPFVTKQQLEQDRALRDSPRYQMQDALLNTPDMAAPELDLAPDMPKPADIVEMDASAPQFIEAALKEMDDFSYEMYMDLSGHGGDARTFESLFEDGGKVMREVGKEVKDAYRKIQDNMSSDLEESVEREKARKAQGAFEEVWGFFENVLKHYGKALKRYERDLPNAKGWMRKLDQARREMERDLSSSMLSKVEKMFNDLSREGAKWIDEIEERHIYREFEDIEDDFDELAGQIKYLKKDHF